MCELILAVYCGPPPYLLNGLLLNVTSYTYQGIAVYQCLPGYTVNGNSQLTCQSNGQWDPVPTCDGN